MSMEAHATRLPSLQHIGQSCYANCVMYVILFVQAHDTVRGRDRYPMAWEELRRLQEGVHTTLEDLWPLLPDGHNFSLHRADCPIDFYTYITSVFFTPDTLRLMTVTRMSAGAGSVSHKISATYNRTTVWNTPPRVLCCTEPATHETMNIEYNSPQYGACTLLDIKTTIYENTRPYCVLGIRRCTTMNNGIDHHSVYPSGSLQIPQGGATSLYLLTAVIFYKHGHYMLLYRLCAPNVWYLFDDTRYPSIQEIRMEQDWDVFIRDSSIPMTEQIHTGCVLLHYTAASGLS